MLEPLDCILCVHCIKHTAQANFLLLFLCHPIQGNCKVTMSDTCLALVCVECVNDSGSAQNTHGFPPVSLQ